MIKLLKDVQERGCASKGELLAFGHDVEHIRLCARYGDLIQVRKGWYALPEERDEVIRAWRVGGRLACISAIDYREGLEPRGELHVEVPGNTARLRSPDNKRSPLSSDEGVVIHWARHPSPGDRRSVGLAAAAAQATTCRRAQT